MANKVIVMVHQMAALSDEELKVKTDEFKQRYQNGESLRLALWSLRSCPRRET